MADTERGHGRGLEGTRQPLVDSYDTAMFDLDGVIYIGPSAVGDAAQQIADIEDAGMRIAFVTNNASRPPESVAKKLRSMGVPANDADVVTSAQAAARLVSRRVPARARVLVVGGEGLVAALAEHDLSAVWSLDDEPAAVVQGFHPDVGWRLLAEGAAAVQAGMPWVASNMDTTLPSAHGRTPGNGLLVEVIAATTGQRPVVAGKPEPALFEETMYRVGGTHPLVVGDRLDTDIEGALRYGADSLLVMTGVTDIPELAAASVAQRPTYVASDLAGLFHVHPEPIRDGDVWSCAGWTAHEAGGELELRGGGQYDDALRALVSLCWEIADRSGQAVDHDRVSSAWRIARIPGGPLP